MKFAAPHSLMLAALACLFAPACLPAIPVVPVTPQNSAQVSGCTAVANWANGLTIGGMIVGLGDGTLGTVAASLPAGPAKTDLGYTSAGLAFLVAAGATVVGLEHSAYSSDRCVDVLGPLPTVTVDPTTVNWSLTDAGAATLPPEVNK
jgi:hypothetical protein